MIRTVPKRTYWIAICVSTFLSLCCIFFYLQAKKKLDQEISSHIQTVGNVTVQDFERTVHDNIISLENLKDRIEESNGDFMEYFESDATRIMDQHPAIQFIEWIDRDGIIREIHPLSENRAAYLLDIKPIKYRYDDWMTNSLNRKSNMTSWVNLTQKGNAFLVDVPIFIKGEFYGTVTAGMDFESQFNELSKNFKNFTIQLIDEEGQPFYSSGIIDKASYAERSEFMSSLQPNPGSSNTWDFQLVFGDSALYTERDVIQKTALSYGILISIIVGFLIVYFLRWRHRTNQQLEINATLTQLNKELEEQKLAAQEASLYKSDFISNMSHEIRTPLNAILGFVDILGSKNLLRNERLYLKLMKNSAQNLLGLVNDILDINKIESGEVEIYNQVFSPSENLKNVIATYETQIAENKLHLNTSIQALSNLSVQSDSSKFDQILTNILTNAIKFTPKGSISIAYAEKIVEDTLLVDIEISDTGVGIPENKLNEIFNRFVQVENGTRKSHVGGGLGLAITNELVQLLGGTIQVKSEYQVGSTFSIHLPLTIASEAEAKITNEIRDLSDLNCLIVDDNRINRMILFNILQQAGIHADSVGSGDEALSKSKYMNYDVVFMDIHMPDMDGFETTEKLLQISPLSKIIGLSADVTVESIRKGKLSGMNEYLTKPIDKDMLFQTLNKLNQSREAYESTYAS